MKHWEMVGVSWPQFIPKWLRKKMFYCMYCYLQILSNFKIFLKFILESIWRCLLLRKPRRKQKVGMKGFSREVLKHMWLWWWPVQAMGTSVSKGAACWFKCLYRPGEVSWFLDENGRALTPEPLRWGCQPSDGIWLCSFIAAFSTWPFWESESIIGCQNRLSGLGLSWT